MALEEHTVAVQSALRILLAIFSLGVLSGIITITLVLWRTKSLVVLPGEEGLSRWERKARQSNRFSAFYLETRFRRLRLATFGSVALCVSSFALLILIDGVWK
ncbi:hypothetical protein QO004_005807 [Rhizobium mesoamericanum]|nr:hypothetical protein [Rhizobium mesoamericanum]